MTRQSRWRRQELKIGTTREGKRRRRSHSQWQGTQRTEPHCQWAAVMSGSGRKAVEEKEGGKELGGEELSGSGRKAVEEKEAGKEGGTGDLLLDLQKQQHTAAHTHSVVSLTFAKVMLCCVCAYHSLIHSSFPSHLVVLVNMIHLGFVQLVCSMCFACWCLCLSLDNEFLCALICFARPAHVFFLHVVLAGMCVCGLIAILFP